MENKKLTLALAGIVVVLLTYIVVQTPKVKAGEELTDALQQIEYLSWMVAQEKLNYQIAIDSIDECKVSWEKKADEAHKNADDYRNEIAKLEGFIKSRTAQ